MAISAKSIPGIRRLQEDDEQFGLSMVLLSIPLSASLPVLGSIGSRMADPLAFTLLVSFVGTLFMASITWRDITRRWNSLLRPRLWKLFSVGFFGTGLANALLFKGLSLTTGSNASILLQTEPVYALILTFLLLGEHPTRSQLLATGFILAGTITVLCPGSFRICAGDLLVLAAPLCLVTANLFAQSCMRDGIPPRIVVTFRIFFGGMVQLPLALFSSSLRTVPWDSPLFITSVGTVALGATLASVCWYWAIAKVSLSRCTTIISAYPVLAVVSSWLFLHEKPQWPQAIGLFLVLAGISMMCRRNKSPEPISPGPEQKR